MAHPSEDMAKMPLSTMLTLACVQALIFTVLGAGLWVATDREIAQFVTFGWHEFAYGVAIAAGLILSGKLLYMVAPRYCENLIRDQAHNLAFLRNKLGLGPIIVLSLCAGIAEEALYRGGVLVFAADYVPAWAALIISSLLFMVIHFAKPRVAIFILFLGLLFGALYLALDSLLAVMVAHALYDIVAFRHVQKEMHRLGVFEEHDDTREVLDGDVVSH